MIHTPAHHDDRKLYHLSLEFMQPEVVEREMQRNLHMKMKLQERILLKDQMMCLKSAGTNEIQSLARKVCKKLKYDKDVTASKIIKYIMRIKIDDVQREIEENKILVNNFKPNFNKIVRKETLSEID